MGILDDAIRQHLDLKRRQGAEDDEIDKLESEAFGPPSRPGDPEFGGQPSEDGAAEGPATPSEEMAAAPASEDDLSEPAADAPFADTGEEPEAETPSALFDHSVQEPVSEVPADPGVGTADPPTPAPAPTDDQPALEPDPQAPEPPIESLDTVEHDFADAIEDTGQSELVEGELEGEPEREDGAHTDEEDVLEETPEFLRDQPEDDELWFEQGEPKDFDF